MAREQLAETVDRLARIIGPVVVREGFELFDLEYKTSGKRHLLRVLIDRPGRTSYAPPPRDEATGPPSEGVGIDDCVRVTKALSPVLDVEDVIQGSYTLEVSSPGINRPLREPRHFALAVGLPVRVKTRVPVDGETFFLATLASAGDEGITLDVAGREVSIPYRLVSKANLEPTF